MESTYEGIGRNTLLRPLQTRFYSSRAFVLMAYAQSSGGQIHDLGQSSMWCLCSVNAIYLGGVLPVDYCGGIRHGGLFGFLAILLWPYFR